MEVAVVTSTGSTTMTTRYKQWQKRGHKSAEQVVNLKSDQIFSVDQSLGEIDTVKSLRFASACLPALPITISFRFIFLPTTVMTMNIRESVN